VVCLTDAMREEVRAKWRIQDDKLLVISNGVDATVFRPSGERSRRELLAVGRLTPQKNLGVLLSAFAILCMETKAAGEAPLSLRVIGDGEELGPLRAQAAALNLDHVFFEGRQPASAVAAALARATVLVMPSTHEGFPLVLLEAMAAGTPVVASALSEIIEAGGDAVLPVEPMTPQRLAEALRRVLADEQLRTDLSDRGVARARSFSWEAANAQVVKLYATVLRTDHPGVGAER
jgi:glycosyltransferase involved in cell wall biosynthesis